MTSTNLMSDLMHKLHLPLVPGRSIQAFTSFDLPLRLLLKLIRSSRQNRPAVLTHLLLKILHRIRAAAAIIEVLHRISSSIGQLFHRIDARFPCEINVKVVIIRQIEAWSLRYRLRIGFSDFGRSALLLLSRFWRG